jgi:Zn ribbon nucleic-acid-binding protein
MEADPRRNDLRKQQRRRRFGPGAVCMVCGEADSVAFHHVPGRNNDEALEGPLCLNCHAKAHEALTDAGVPLQSDRSRTLLERMEAVLRSLATFFDLLARSLQEWANRLGQLISHLDEAVPDWREWKEARS